MSTSADMVRSMLESLAAGTVPTRASARAALEAFNQLHPPGAPVQALHGWCVCGHQHSAYTATGKSVEECDWVFCECRGFSPRPFPNEAERERLVARLHEQQREYHARRARGGR